MCECQADIAYVACEIRRTGRLHEHRVSARDKGANALGSDKSTSTLCGRPTHWCKYTFSYKNVK